MCPGWQENLRLSLAWPRTLTLLATTTAGPGTSGVVLRSATAAGFLAAGFFSTFLAGCCVAFLADFFFEACFLPVLAAGALVFAGAGASVGAGVTGKAAAGAAGGGLVADCANKLVVSIAPMINQ